MQNYTDIYADFLKKHFNLKKQLTIVCDPSNGTSGIVLEKLMDVPNLTLKLINNIPDANFPAHGPNPLEPGATDQLGKAVVEMKADFGVAFDADGDRAFFVDETGKMLPSHLSSLLLFKNNKAPYIGDELVYQALKHLDLYSDVELKASKVGSRFVKDALKEYGASAGAEFSGHYYFEKFFGLDSGIFAMIEVANAVSVMEEKISHYFASISSHELVNVSVKTEGKNVATILEKIETTFKDKGTIGHLDGITIDLGKSWISIRSSNTEPILRLIAGAPTEAEAKKLIDEVRTLI